jgi:hypothetical protein
VDRRAGQQVAGGEVGKLVKMEERLHQRVVGQDERVLVYCETILPEQVRVAARLCTSSDARATPISRGFHGRS